MEYYPAYERMLGSTFSFISNPLEKVALEEFLFGFIVFVLFYLFRFLVLVIMFFLVYYIHCKTEEDKKA